MKVLQVEDPVFKTEPLFVLGCSRDRLASYLQRRFGVHIDADGAAARATTTGQMLTFDRAPWRVVWVKDAKDIGVLLHELFHLVTRICADRAIPIVAHFQSGENGDETAAYLFEFFARAVIKRGKRWQA